MTGGELQAYGSLGDLALIRATCDSAIPATGLDRTLLQSGPRLYDVYLVRSNLPFTFDLPYHCHGKMEQSVATEPWADYPEEKDGYAYFEDPVAAQVDDDWNCTWRVPRGRVEMHALGEPGSEVIFGTTPKGAHELPTAMIRRKTDDTVYAAAMDVVAKAIEPGQRPEEAEPGEPTLASLQKIGDGKDGYGLVAELAGGGREALLVNFTGSAVRLGDWTTDARVAFVRTDGEALTGFYVAGGSKTEGPSVRVESTEPTLLACRTVTDGLVEVANQGSAATEVTLAGMAVPEAVHAVDAAGKRTSAGEPLTGSGGAFSFAIDRRSKVELTRGERPTVAAYEAAQRKKKVEAMLREEARGRREAENAAEAQVEAAKTDAVPADYFALVQAEDIKAQDGGEVNVTDRKTATYGEAFSGWNDPGHWIDYEIAVEHDGWYQVVMKYCREGGPTTRSLRVDGEFPHEAFQAIEMNGTGGWSNGADNWRMWRLEWPLLDDRPFLVHLTAGAHTIRVENVSGSGLNLDYIVLAAPEMEVTRERVEK